MPSSAVRLLSPILNPSGCISTNSPESPALSSLLRRAAFCLCCPQRIRKRDPQITVNAICKSNDRARCSCLGPLSLCALRRP
eukprot:5543482-Pleurochrysis_carterae.AAC.1